MPIAIPCSNSQEISVLFSSFVNELVIEYGRLLQPSQNWKKEAVWIKYLSPYETNKVSDVTAHMNTDLSNEHIRKAALEAFSIEMFNMLANGVPFMGEIIPTVEMKKAYDSFVSELKPIENFNLLISRFGFREDDLSDAKIMGCFLDCLNYDVIRQKGVEPYAISVDEFGRSKTVFKDHISPLNKFLKNPPVRRCYETDVLPFMKNTKGWPADVCEQMTAFLHADEHEFEWTGPDKFGHTYVAVSWEALGGEDKRAERILYDNREVNDGWMNLSDIRKQYDYLARKSGLRPLSLNPNMGGEYTEGRGNGDYRYNPTRKRGGSIDLKKELVKYVADKACPCSKDDILTYANSLKKCSMETVEQYLSGAEHTKPGRVNGVSGYYCDEAVLPYPGFEPSSSRGKNVTRELAIKVSRDILVEENGPLHIVNELIPRFQAKTDIRQLNPVSFRNLLKNAEGVLFKFQQGGGIELSVPVDKAKGFDVDAFLKPNTKPTGRKEAVQHKAADLLLNAEGHSMKKKDLIEAIFESGVYPRDKSVTNIYGYLKDSLFIVEGNTYTLNDAEYKSRFS